MEKENLRLTNRTASFMETAQKLEKIVKIKRTSDPVGKNF